MTNKKTKGLIAAPFTPLRANGAVNLDAVAPYARWLHRHGVVGAFICGTTGEGMSLTMDERRQVAERWVATAPAGLRVIVHVGHNALADCQALAAHAQDIGADKKFPRNTMVACSPTSDGKRVFFMFSDGTVAGFDVDGKQLWKQRVHEHADRPTAARDRGNACAHPRRRRRVPGDLLYTVPDHQLGRVISFLPEKSA